MAGLLDVYIEEDKAVLWIKTDDGKITQVNRLLRTMFST